MGINRTVRTISAAIRAAERDAKRRQRELERERKYYERMRELDQAAYEVELYENHIDVIQSIHKECSPTIDWQKILDTPGPVTPINRNKQEKAARTKAESYKPSFLDKLFNRIEKKRKKFENEISNAIDEDLKEYNINLSDWEDEKESLIESQKLARRILNNDESAKVEAIKELDNFSEISNLGSSIVFTVNDNSIIEAEVNVHGKEIIPSETKSLLKSGKLSVKKMATGKFNEFYQDYVCSCVLRVANEIFAIVPDDMVIVTAVDELLNTRTGHLEVTPILSACISRPTIKSFNLEKIDPSDSMTNFIHHMKFKKNSGFDAVERVQPDLLELA